MLDGNWILALILMSIFGLEPFLGSPPMQMCKFCTAAKRAPLGREMMGQRRSCFLYLAPKRIICITRVAPIGIPPSITLAQGSSLCFYSLCRVVQLRHFVHSYVASGTDVDSICADAIKRNGYGGRAALSLLARLGIASPSIERMLQEKHLTDQTHGIPIPKVFPLSFLHGKVRYIPLKVLNGVRKGRIYFSLYPSSLESHGLLRPLEAELKLQTLELQAPNGKRIRAFDDLWPFLLPRGFTPPRSAPDPNGCVVVSGVVPPCPAFFGQYANCVRGRKCHFSHDK